MIPDLKTFLPDLIRAWNSHNLERVLSHYSDDFELTSPIVKERLNMDGGTLKGKENVRIWWRRVLDKVPDFHLELVDSALATDSTVAMIQKSSHNNKHVVSNFTFNDDGKISKEVYFN